MVVVLADPALYTYTGGTPPTLEEVATRFARWADGSPRAGEAWHNWVIRLSDGLVAIGHLQATVLDAGASDDEGRSADIAWVIGTQWQRRGYATEAARALVRWLQSTGVDVITAHVHPDHAASARVAAAATLQPTSDIEDGEVVWRRVP